MQSLQRTSPQLQLLPVNLDARRKGFTVWDECREKLCTSTGRRCAIRRLDSGRVLARIESCLRWAFDPLWHGHGLLRIAGKAVDTSVYSSLLQQMLHKTAHPRYFGAVFVPPDADINLAMHYGMLSLTFLG